MNSSQVNREDDIETLFQESIDDDQCNLQEAKFCIKQTVGSITSFNYDDNTMFPSAQPELCSDDEDEDILVIAKNCNTNLNVSKLSNLPETNSTNTINTNQFTPNRIDDSQSFTFMPSLDDSFEKIKAENDVEASRRYLTINSAPLYRWSLGMIPSVPKRLFEQHDRLDSEENESDCEVEAEEQHDQGFEVSNRTTIPVIVGGEVGNKSLVKSAWISERLKHMAKAYNDRGTLVKNAIENISKSEESSDEENEDEKNAIQSSVPIELMFGDEWSDHDSITCIPGAGLIVNFKVVLYKLKSNLLSVFEPQSITYITWLFVVASMFLYNSICIFFRAVFPFEQETGTQLFFILDLIADLIYLLDMIWFKTKLMYIKNGEWIVDPVKTGKNYLRKPIFLVDFVALLPFDWVLLYINILPPSMQRLTRLNRMLKIESFWEFFTRIDTIMNNPYLFRIIHTLLYKLYIIHIGACVYYLSSWYEGFGATPWTYNQEGIAYLRCFYFAFRTTTSIGGRLPKPNNQFERIYMMFAWLLGVFVFAMVIGQIRDIVANATRNQNYYHDVLNKAADYMRVLNLPSKLQKRVRYWLNFTWELQKTFNENEILQVLPHKIRTDIALSVHYHTLSRVELFKDINRSVLRDLVLKLRPILFLPGEYICRTGEIGHEMYIVNKGMIQVIGGDGSILVSLREGSIFGEIAILNLEGFTRRTADVRANGYAQLFALKKSDLWETLKNYPEYQNVLKKKVNRILKKKKKESAVKQDKKLETIPTEDWSDTDEELPGDDKLSIKKVTSSVNIESIVKDRPRTPKLFNTVLEVMRPESTLNQYFSRSISMSSSFESNLRSIDPEMSIDEQDNETLNNI